MNSGKVTFWRTKVDGYGFFIVQEQIQSPKRKRQRVLSMGTAEPSMAVALPSKGNRANE